MSNKNITIELVNKEGTVIGLKEKFATHKNPVPLHRAISVIIYNPTGKRMLIHKRASNKFTWPLSWSNAVCTHPFPKESYKHAATRRLKEELGFTTALKEILRFTYKAKYDKTWGENEYDVVFVGKYSGTIKPDPSEVLEHKWIEVNKLAKDVAKNPQLYSPWFKIILKKLDDLKSL